MSPAASTPHAAAPSPVAIEQLRSAVNVMFGAERRLRGRDHNRAGELTIAQLRSIATLGRQREMTAGQLARAAELNPASVTAMLDHLEEGGIVERRRSREDRRVCHVSLTSEGWRVLEAKLAEWQAMWQERLDGFDAAELETATRVIGRIAEMLDSLALGDRPSPS